MHGIAIGIEAGQDIRGDGYIGPKHIFGRNRQILGKAAGAVDADADGVGAQMTPACQAIAAAFADDVAFARHDIADPESGNIGAHPDDFAGEFMADGHRHGDGLLRPVVPVVDMHVRAANGRLFYFNEDVVIADFRLGDIVQPQPLFSIFFY